MFIKQAEVMKLSMAYFHKSVLMSVRYHILVYIERTPNRNQPVNKLKFVSMKFLL